MTKFFYDPGSIDIAKFDITLDHLHWKLLCKQAQDLTTTPEFLLGSILERYLIQCNYLDPKSNATNPFKVAVTIQDLRDNPNTTLNIETNQLLYKKAEEKKSEETKGGLKNLFEDDDLNF